MSTEIPPIDVNERVNKDYDKLIKPWALPKPKEYCFKNVNVIDTLNSRVISSVNVFTSNGLISRIQRLSSFIPAGITVVDGTGKYLCPGLIDNHVHVQTPAGEEDLTRLMLLPKTTALMRVGHSCNAILSRGFTTVRDCGGTEFYVKKAVEEGVIHGPRLLICGRAISQTGGHGDMRPGDLPGEAYDSCSCHLNLLGRVADGVDECLKKSREELRLGANFVKIMGSGGVASPTDKITNIQYTEEEVRTFVKVADSYGTYVTAHCYTAASIKHCVLNGVKGIEHGNLIDDETAKLMANLGCYLTPTLITYKVMASDQFSSFLPADSREKNLQVLQFGLGSLAIAKRNGLKLCYGSDLLGAMNGYQTQEFFLRAKILTPGEILQSATINPAAMNSLADKLGQVQEGFIADLLLLDANPLEDISILDEPEKYLKMVMKDGIIFKSDSSVISPDVWNL